MTGNQDEPAALAFMLDEAGLQPDDGGAQVVAEAACRHGRIGSLQLLLERGWLLPQHVCAAVLLRACAVGAHRATAAWLLDTLVGDAPGEHPYTEDVFAAAAQLGSVPLLQQLRERGCPCDEFAWDGAAAAGCAALLQWLHDEGCPMPVSFGAVRVRRKPYAACCCARTSALRQWQAGALRIFADSRRFASVSLRMVAAVHAVLLTGATPQAAQVHVGQVCLREREKTREGQASVRAAERRLVRCARRQRVMAEAEARGHLSPVVMAWIKQRASDAMLRARVQVRSGGARPDSLRSSVGLSAARSTAVVSQAPSCSTHPS